MIMFLCTESSARNLKQKESESLMFLEGWCGRQADGRSMISIIGLVVLFVARLALPGGIAASHFQPPQQPFTPTSTNMKQSFQREF